MKFTIKNLGELNNFAYSLSKTIIDGDVFSLKGDLGAGKTTFVQMIGKHLGVEDYITSPTFSIVNIYLGEFKIYHLDLYRLEDPSEIESFDYETYFYPDGISFIEWADKGGTYIPDEMIEILINADGDERNIEIKEKTKRSKEIVERLKVGNR